MPKSDDFVCPKGCDQGDDGTPPSFVHGGGGYFFGDDPHKGEGIIYATAYCPVCGHSYGGVEIHIASVRRQR